MFARTRQFSFQFSLRTSYSTPTRSFTFTALTKDAPQNDKMTFFITTLSLSSFSLAYFDISKRNTSRATRGNYGIPFQRRPELAYPSERPETPGEPKR